jgi:hypothetical protein
LIGFAHPGLFWAGLGLVAVPILIHLFFRRRHRVIRWAAMDFLLAALKKQKRRMEIENLLLLLLRCAAILLLAVAVARPAFQTPSLPFGGGARAVVLVVDTSLSMGAQHTGRTALERAQDRAAQFLSELPDGSQVTVVASRDDQAAGGPRALLENADADGARAALPQLRVAHGPNRLAEVFRLVGKELASLRGRRMVVLLSDLQRSDWYAPDGDERRKGVFEALKQLDSDPEAEEKTPVVLVDVGQEETANVTLTELSVDAGRLAFAGKLLGVTATLVNYGPTPTSGTVTLYLARPGDGQWEKTLTEEVTVPGALGFGKPEPLRREFLPRVPASDSSARFRAQFTPHAASAGNDRLAADSERLLALRARPPVRVLPVSTFFKATDLLQDVALVQVIDLLPSIYPPQLAAADLSGVDIVLWAAAETSTLTAEDVTKLEAFVRSGGGLLWYCGDEPEDQIRSLFTEGKEDPLFPMRLGPKQSDEEHKVRIEREDERTQKHPLFAETNLPFAFSPMIHTYRKVSDYAEGAVIAKYENGDPAVLEKGYGRGRVVVVTTTPDDRSFELNGSLLPAIFFFNAAQYLVWESPNQRNVTVGEPVEIPLPAGAREVEVTPPQAAGGPTQHPVPEGAQTFLLTDTAAPGFYELVARGPTGPAALPRDSTFDVAVNLDASEGDLRRVPVERLRSDYQGAPLVMADEGEILPRGVQGDTGEASRAFLGGVVGLLLLELFCAYRFGTRRRTTA